MKRTPLKRKTPLKRSSTPMKRTPLKKVSTSPHKVERRKKYEKNKKTYLKKNPNCEICGCKGKLDLHHKAGRSGTSPNKKNEMEENYTNMMTFMAVCRICHDFIHRNPKESREKGWLV